MPEARHYPWTRYWLPQADEPVFWFDDFLADPESEIGKDMSPGLARLDDLDGLPCLVLLGEPGMGKSTCLRDDRDRILSAGAGTVSFHDLRGFSDWQTLEASILDSSEVQGWHGSDSVLWLLLDSLDECQLEIATAAARLPELLRKLGTERLRVRLASRSAVFPSSLEGELQTLFALSPDIAMVYKLAPLRRRDVETAVRTEGASSPDAFFEELFRLRAVPLAVRPVTLWMLIQEFISIGKLPSTQLDLYSRGCRGLCEDPQARQDLGHDGKLSPEQRVNLASRIAAATLFGNREAVWYGPEANCHLNDVLLGDLILDGIEREHLREALNTGLFTPLGGTRVGWSHRTFQEFLAARFIRDLPAAQAASLFVDSSGNSVVPQLYDSLGWAAAICPDLFDRVVGRDPMALLASAAHLRGDQERMRLVDALLKLVSTGSHRRFGVSEEVGLAKLAHPALAGQLRIVIAEPSRPVGERSLACRIAVACGVGGLDIEMAALASDGSLPISLRAWAAAWIAKFGNKTARLSLRPYLQGLPEDANDELKGHSLRALFPGFLTIGELFPLITSQRRSSVGDPYDRFLEDLPGLVDADSIVPALRWVRGLGAKQTVGIGVGRVIDGILVKSLTLLETPGILRELASALLSRSRFGEHVPERLKAAPIGVRLRILDSLIEVEEAAEPILPYYLSAASGVGTGDLSDLLLHAREAADSRAKRRIGEVALALCPGFDVDLLFNAFVDDPELHELFQIRLGPIALDSPEALSMKENFGFELRRREREAAIDAERIAEGRVLSDLLARSSSGDTEAFWRFVRRLANGGGVVHSGEPDLRKLPGWKLLDDERRGQVAAAARIYLENAPDEYCTWPDENRGWNPGVAGYQGLRYLAAVEPSALDGLTPEVWARWSEAVIRFPQTESEKKAPESVRLRRLAFERAPGHARATLARVFRKKVAAGDSGYFLRAFWEQWCPEVESAALEIASSADTTPSTVFELLVSLLTKDSAPGLALARQMVAAHEGSCDERAISAARGLLYCRDLAGIWPDLWVCFGDDTEFGMAVLGASANELGSLHGRLSRQAIVELAVWLFRNDPGPAHVVRSGATSEPEWLRIFRDQLFQTLAGVGAVDELVWAAAELPDVHWLPQLVEEARKARSGGRWLPPKPADIFRLVEDSRRRLVRTELELRNLLLDTLGTVERDLHGEHGVVRALWNVCGDGPSYKSETDISAILAHLIREKLTGRGVAVNREVQVRVENNRTDIHVSSSATGGDSFTVVVEAKGEWNSELKTAIRTQLVDKYLRPLGLGSGIYLVYGVGEQPIEGVRALVSQLAAEVSSDSGINVAAVVLDCRLRCS